MRSRQKGFSLIELLIVIAIVAVLATVIMIAINPATRIKKARDTQRKQDISQISNALVSFEVLHEQYPDEGECDSSVGSDSNPCPVNPPQSGWSNSSQIYQSMVNQESLKNVPTDPTNNSIHHYRYEPQGPTQSPCSGSNKVCRYWIGARLEAPKDANKPVFRCSDNETLSNGPGCIEVANFYE